MKISQQEVIELLEKEEKPLSRGQIAEKLDQDPIKVSHRINKLLKHNEISCVELDRNEVRKLLPKMRVFRRMRFYYIEGGGK